MGQSVSAGNLLVAAAGNSGVSTIPAPARYASVMAVSGTLKDDSFADEYVCPTFTPESNYGSEIDISAPFWAYSMDLDSDYRVNCGTSMSAPYVSGAAALVWSKNPTWTAAQVRSQLESTARDLGASGWDQYFGHGRLDVAAAVGIALPSVAIDGPLEVDTAGVYEWTAEPDGGLGSYTYEWYWQVDFQTPTCNYQTAWTLVEDEEDFYAMAVSELDYDFRLRVDIETHGETASGGIKVYVGDGSQVCPT